MDKISGNNSFWILKVKGSESAFGGNEGYEDQIESQYVYDTTVKNHDKISIGDVVIITGKKYIEGFGKIEKIDKKTNISKNRYRCPVCNSQEHYERKGKTPKYKCRNKHEFDEPTTEIVDVTQYTAIYGDTFIKAPRNTSSKALDSYYIRRNMYYSIQLANSDYINDYFPQLFNKLIPKNDVKIISNVHINEIDLLEYIPLEMDTRLSRYAKVISRKGQNAFRNKLFQIYGIYCMISACEIREAIEAAHINPYRGNQDNHARNGLLLRRDLHALFDANLLGIHPESNEVFIHPSLENSEYKVFKGKFVSISTNGIVPSQEALKIRWLFFNKNCGIKD